MYCLDFEIVVKSNDNPNFVSNGRNKLLVKILFLEYFFQRSRTCLNNVPENRAHLNYVPKVPKIGHKLGTKSAPPQSILE